MGQKLVCLTDKISGFKLNEVSSEEKLEQKSKGLLRIKKRKKVKKIQETSNKFQKKEKSG